MSIRKAWVVAMVVALAAGGASALRVARAQQVDLHPAKRGSAAPSRLYMIDGHKPALCTGGICVSTTPESRFTAGVPSPQISNEKVSRLEQQVIQLRAENEQLKAEVRTRRATERQFLTQVLEQLKHAARAHGAALPPDTDNPDRSLTERVSLALTAMAP